MKYQFDSSFYATAATVIPVLFLALTLQSTSSQNTLFDSLITRLNDAVKAIQKERKFSLAIFFILFFIAFAVLLAGVLGEILALVALFRQSDYSGQRQFVLESVIGLLVITAAGPAWALISAYGRAVIDAGKAIWDSLKQLSAIVKRKPE